MLGEGSRSRSNSCSSHLRSTMPCLPLLPPSLHPGFHVALPLTPVLSLQIKQQRERAIDRACACARARCCKVHTPTHWGHTTPSRVDSDGKSVGDGKTETARARTKADTSREIARQSQSQSQRGCFGGLPLKLFTCEWAPCSSLGLEKVAIFGFPSPHAHSMALCASTDWCTALAGGAATVVVAAVRCRAAVRRLHTLVLVWLVPRFHERPHELINSRQYL